MEMEIDLNKICEVQITNKNGKKFLMKVVNNNTIDVLKICEGVKLSPITNNFAIDPGQTQVIFSNTASITE